MLSPALNPDSRTASSISGSNTLLNSILAAAVKSPNLVGPLCVMAYSAACSGQGPSQKLRRAQSQLMICPNVLPIHGMSCILQTLKNCNNYSNPQSLRPGTVDVQYAIVRSGMSTPRMLTWVGSLMRVPQ